MTLHSLILNVIKWPEKINGKECKDWFKYVKFADALLTQSEIQAKCFNAFTHLITIKVASNHYI